MNENYNDIMFRINFLYDIINNNDIHYIYKPIVKTQITLLDIKNNNINIDKVLYGELLFKQNNKYYIKNDKCLICIGKYSDTMNNNNLSNPILFNIALHYIFSEFVINDKFNHILLPIIFKDITKEDLTKFDIHYKDGYIFVMQYIDGLTSLRQFLKNDELNEDQWMNIIFQVLYILYKLNDKYNTFIHNNLTLDNIFIEPNNKKNVYTIDNKNYIFKNEDYIIKLTNFENSYLSGYINLNVNKTNLYIDVITFFNEIKNIEKVQNINVDNLLPNEIIHKYFNKYLQKNIEGGEELSSIFDEEMKIKDDIYSSNTDNNIGYNNLAKIYNINSHSKYMSNKRMKIPKFSDSSSIAYIAEKQINNNDLGLYGKQNGNKSMVKNEYKEVDDDTSEVYSLKSQTPSQFNPLALAPYNGNGQNTMQQFNPLSQQMPQQFNPLSQQMPQQFNQMPQQFNQMPQQFNQMPQQFNQMPQQFNQMPQQFNQMPQQLPMQPQVINGLGNNYGYGGGLETKNEVQTGSGTSKYCFMKNGKLIQNNEAGFFF